MEKLTLHINLTDTPNKSCIFNILDTNNQLRPEVRELIEAGILKYFHATQYESLIKIKDHNEQLTLTVKGSIEYLQNK